MSSSLKKAACKSLQCRKGYKNHTKIRTNSTDMKYNCDGDKWVVPNPHPKRGGAQKVVRKNRTPRLTPVSWKLRVILDDVKQGPEVSTRRFAARLGHSYPTVSSRLQSPGCWKILPPWIRHVLADGMRFIRASICQSLLLRPHRKEFLEEPIGDGSWILCYSNTHRACVPASTRRPPAQVKIGLVRVKQFSNTAFEAIDGRIPIAE